VEILVDAGADVTYVHSDDGWTALMSASIHDHLPVCEYLVSKGADLMAPNNDGESALDMYGRCVSLSPDRLAVAHARLVASWRAGPHPSQVQRRKDEAWARRKALMQVLTENHYRPLSHVLATLAAEAVDPAAAIPDVELDTPAKRHAHLLGQVLSNEGIHRLIVSYL